MASSNNSAQQIIEKADELYFAREHIANVWTSVALLQSKVSEVDGYEIAWRLSRALFFLGQEEQEAESARALHLQGVHAGKSAVRAMPERVEGHFWLGVNLALLARAEPRLKAVTTAIRAKRALESAITIDSPYHAAGPLRVLARLQQELPRLLGGGSARAQVNYKRAITLAPLNTVTRLYFAEFLLEIGEIDQARAQLEMVRKAAFDPDWAFEIKRDQRIAGEFLARL
jgi:hypothetical protein